PRNRVVDGGVGVVASIGWQIVPAIPAAQHGVPGELIRCAHSGSEVVPCWFVKAAGSAVDSGERQIAKTALCIANGHHQRLSGAVRVRANLATWRKGVLPIQD